jgi:hypothetical protein
MPEFIVPRKGSFLLSVAEIMKEDGLLVLAYLIVSKIGGIIMSDESDELYQKLVYQNEDKFYQLRLVVNEFRNKQYVHVRKYFQTYEGDYQASKEGISMEASMGNILSLLDGLLEIVSKEEGIAAITEHFGNKILELRQPA